MLSMVFVLPAGTDDVVVVLQIELIGTSQMPSSSIQSMPSRFGPAGVRNRCVSKGDVALEICADVEWSSGSVSNCHVAWVTI